MANYDFANGYSGDSRSLEFIIKTVQAKNYFIPGVTANPQTVVSVSGSEAFFYTKGQTTVSAHSLGEGTTGTVRGGKRIDISLVSGAAYDFIVPGPLLKTVNPQSVVDGYLVDETITLLNKRHSDGITAVLSGAAAKTYPNGTTDAYVALTDAIATFITDNKATNIRPTGIFVKPGFWADLLQSNKFIRSTDRADLKVFDGQIGEVSGIPVIVVPDLSAADFVLINAIGVAAPINIHSFKAVAADVGGGTAYLDGIRGLGAIGFNFKVVTSSDEGFLGNGGYYVAKFTEASS